MRVPSRPGGCASARAQRHGDAHARGRAGRGFLQGCMRPAVHAYTAQPVWPWGVGVGSPVGCWACWREVVRSLCTRGCEDYVYYISYVMRSAHPMGVAYISRFARLFGCELRAFARQKGVPNPATSTGHHAGHRLECFFSRFLEQPRRATRSSKNSRVQQPAPNDDIDVRARVMVLRTLYIFHWVCRQAQALAGTHAMMTSVTRTVGSSRPHLSKTTF